tara:strand:+ start:365 stop:493 length:129 start_codon:yes stop_codon:yes gene_type:complete
VCQRERDTGQREGVTIAEAKRVEELERVAAIGGLFNRPEVST